MHCDGSGSIFVSSGADGGVDVRFYRSDQMDTYPSEDEPERLEHVREAVDELPEPEQYLISRIFFGGCTVAEAARELDMPDTEARRYIAEGLGELRAVLDHDSLGRMPAAD